MSIRLETSKRTGIDNHQGQIAPNLFVLDWTRKMQREHPKAVSRTKDSGLYNCHGLTFASRRTRIEKNSGITSVLADDRYEEVTIAETIGGDVVVYYSEAGDPNHSGIVVEICVGLNLPMICSKWGSAGEFVHALSDCPSAYGPKHRFFRCRL